MLQGIQGIALQTLRRTGWQAVASSSRPASVAYAGFSSFRHASTSSSGPNETPIPARKQPDTSPDRTSTPLAQTQGSSSKPDNHTRDSATISQDTKDAEAQERFAEDGHTLMSEQEKEILEKLQKNFPGGTVAVQDVSGGCGTFFAISVASDRFRSLSRIKQHQLVNKVLEDEVKTWHGMQLKTVAN